MHRAFEEKDHKTLCSWWRKRGWPELPLAMLPNVGVIVEEKAAAFLIQTDTAVAWLEWIVSDPEAENTGEAVSEAIHILTKVAKELGFAVVMTSINNKRLEQRFENEGYVAQDVDMTNMVRRL